MNKDRIEGRAKDVAGRIERQAGEWTGDKKLQIKGTAKQAEGKVQNAAGKILDAAKEVLKNDDAEQDQTEKRARAGRR
jgi:uncharacterized protein YjbJ (UPF0337 family)